MRALRYIGIELVFFALILLASLRVERLLELAPAHLAALAVLGGFAVFRSARTISYNGVMAWVRAPFCEVVRDSSGAGNSVEPKPGSVFGELLACPVCSGTWAALVLVNLFLYAPAVGWVLLVVLGLAGMSEALHWQAERAEWQGRAAREDAGTQWLQKNQAQPVSRMPLFLDMFDEVER
jgi:hypothetical protein